MLNKRKKERKKEKDIQIETKIGLIGDDYQLYIDLAINIIPYETSKAEGGKQKLDI